MNMIRKFFKNIAERYIPELVSFKGGEELYLIAIYRYEVFPSDELSEAIERLKAQMPIRHDLGVHEYLLYERDKKELAYMCNRYCMNIGNSFDMLGDFLRFFALSNYKTSTNLYCKLL